MTDSRRLDLREKRDTDRQKKIEVSPERKANFLLRSGVMSAARRGLLSSCMISSGEKAETQILVTSELKIYSNRGASAP